VKDLTIKQQRFAQHYAREGVASAAYRHAYDVGEMSAETIATAAYQVKQLPHVKAAIEELRAIILKAESVTMDRVQSMLVDIADGKGMTLPAHEGETPIAEYIDPKTRKSAMDSLTKILGGNAPEKVEHSGSVSVPGMIEAFGGGGVDDL
jgi:hypothetical protein